MNYSRDLSVEVLRNSGAMSRLISRVPMCLPIGS